MQQSSFNFVKHRYVLLCTDICMHIYLICIEFYRYKGALFAVIDFVAKTILVCAWFRMACLHFMHYDKMVKIVLMNNNNKKKSIVIYMYY
uniref:Uncharacterized protein n=1 Tax=Glossina brevipalpis TaxID=37001 RepID=A0A1A9W1V9_9MUSC